MVAISHMHNREPTGTLAPPAENRSDVTAIREPVNGHGLHHSGRQLGPALAPPVTDDCTTGTGTHTSAEPVLAVPATIVGLEGVLHGEAP